MTVFELYKKTNEILQQNHIEDASFEAELLLAYAFDKDINWRRLHPKDEVSSFCLSVYSSALRRRLSGEPIQYILGNWSFYGRDFKVGQGVLIPRPETEELIPLALSFLQSKKEPVVFDLCAGSGCIGLTVAKECPHATVYLFEKYSAAYAYLQKNADGFQLPNVHLLQADIQDGLPKHLQPLQADLLISNPPYIPTKEISTLQKEVQKEPVTALDGGNDGLYFYRVIYDKWLDSLKTGAQILLECGNQQADDIASIFQNRSSESHVIYDFNAVDRIVQIKL